MASTFASLAEKWCVGTPVRRAGAGLSLTLEGHAIDISVIEVSDQEVAMSAAWRASWNTAAPGSLMPSLDDLASSVSQQRSGLLSCTAAGGGIEVRMPLYLDGLSRQGFLDAVGEVGRAIAFLQDVSAGIAQNSEKFASLEADMAAARRGAADAAAAVSRAAQAGPPAATHRVPAAGARAWAAPDPSRDAVATLAGGTEVAVLETSGAWARVLASNGWSGWVDGRLLEPIQR